MHLVHWVICTCYDWFWFCIITLKTTPKGLDSQICMSCFFRTSLILTYPNWIPPIQQELGVIDWVKSRCNTTRLSIFFFRVLAGDVLVVDPIPKALLSPKFAVSQELRYKHVSTCCLEVHKKKCVLHVPGASAPVETRLCSLTAMGFSPDVHIRIMGIWLLPDILSHSKFTNLN